MGRLWPGTRALSAETVAGAEASRLRTLRGARRATVFLVAGHRDPSFRATFQGGRCVHPTSLGPGRLPRSAGQPSRCQARTPAPRASLGAMAFMERRPQSLRTGSEHVDAGRRSVMMFM